MTRVLGRRGRPRGDDAEMGGRRPQAKEHLEPLELDEAGRTLP